MEIVAVRYTTAPGIEEQPVIGLVSWRIFALAAGTLHFVGFRSGQAAGKGRVSTAIVRFDPGALTGVTQSGRVYRLEGPEGDGHVLDVLRDAWLATHGIAASEAAYVSPADAVRKAN